MFKAIKNFFSKYRHAFVLFCFVPLYVWYFFVSRLTTPIWTVHCPLDDAIPFIPWFVIFYYVWYLYVSLPLIWFVFTSRTDFLRMAMFLFLSMGTCHVLFIALPTMIDFRPDISQVQGGGFVNFLLRFIYWSDPPRNVFPSLHCIESVAIHVTMCHSETGRKHKWMWPISFVVVVLICLSTVFIKQHSVLDVISGVGIALPVGLIVYLPKWKFLQPSKSPVAGLRSPAGEQESANYEVL